MNLRVAITALSPALLFVACAPEGSLEDLPLPTEQTAITEQSADAAISNADVGADADAATPEMKLDASALEFGRVAPGERVTIEVRIYNVGAGALNLGAIELEGDGFWLDQRPDIDQLLYAEQASVAITFWSMNPGEFEGALTLHSDDPTGPMTLGLSAHSSADVDPPADGEGDPLGDADDAPLHQWTVEQDTADQIGAAHGHLYGDAYVRRGALFLDGDGDYLETDPIDVDVEEKTLVSWVALGSLDQGGGSALTLQDPRGVDIFDGIVYAELVEGEWMAGSDHHNRSLDLGGAEEGSLGTVMLAIAYSPDGQIAVYRDGELYGDPYLPGVSSDGESDQRLQLYPAGVANVVMGLRHEDTGVGGCVEDSECLFGRIEEARIYDRALYPIEIAALFEEGPAVD